MHGLHSCASVQTLLTRGRRDSAIAGAAATGAIGISSAAGAAAIVAALIQAAAAATTAAALDDLREIIIGHSAGHQLILVNFTSIDDRVRIFSARKATRRERKDYEENVGS
jgi:uncharacterized DUF497 family protein